MAQTFVLRDFLRHISFTLLAEYCKQNNIPFTLNSQETDEAALERFITVLNALPRAIQEQVELDLQEIYDLSPNTGVSMLIQEAKERKQVLPEEFKDMSQNDAALWFYLNQQNVFSEVSVLYEVSETRGWKDVYLNPVEFSRVTGKNLQLEEALSSHLLQTELKGRNCVVEEYPRDGRVCYVAYPEDYAQADVLYDGQNSLRKKQIRKPVFKIYFVYEPEDGRLRVKAKGGTQRIIAYQKIFSSVILGDHTGPVNNRIFDLNKLKNKEFVFSYSPEDNVEFVRIKSLRLSYINGGKRVILEVGDSAIMGIADFHEWIESMHLPLELMNITQAIIQVKFKPTPERIKRTKGTVTVRLTFPNSHDLADRPEHRKVKELLRRWGLDRKRDEAVI